jgi:hypothetical protein
LIAEEMPSSMKPVTKAARILKLQGTTVTAWHGTDDVKATVPLERLVLEQHRFNFDLWHEEDQARRTDVTDAEIARVKRAIDGLNQKRNDAIETLDQYFIADIAAKKIKAHKAARLNTETPGSVIDRLSVLSLRIYHMQEEIDRKDATAEHRKKCSDKLKLMNLQKKNLSKSFDELLADLYSGKKILRSYRQFKMYNDPSLNPALYAKKK